MANAAEDAVINAVIANAKSLPELVNGLETHAPKLADAVKGKALIASKTPWGVVIAGIIGWAVAKYGFGWDNDMIELVSGLFVLAGSYVARWLTAGRITSIIIKKIGG